jgi:alpha-glucosidase
MTVERLRPGEDVSEPTNSSFRFGDDWWRRGVIYQIYPLSFADSDGDGIGDLPGIIGHLDHLGPSGMGIDAIWLSPIYPSPGRDGGYDVVDHESVDPRFGTEADFDRLVAEAHRRGIRVVLDLVMNHTSEEHPWFEASRTSRDDPFGDWYLWRDPSGMDREGSPIPPNDWVSWFGGPAWTYDEARRQFYHHTFLSEQPELDWRNPKVEAAQFAMVERWIARGVDGFRLDTFNVFLKHPDTPSNPRRAGTSAWTRQVHRYDIDQPDLPALIGRFRERLDRRPGTMSVGEMFVGTTEGAAALTVDRHLVFDWELLGQPWSAAGFRSAIRRRERAFGVDRWPTVVLSNHDQPRHASRLVASAGLPAGDQDAIAKAAAVLLLTIRGTPFLYYGEEIGMGDVSIPPSESVDPPAARVGPDFLWWDRSQARTPMPWSAGVGAGFSTGRPWLRLASDRATRNVEIQAADPDSVLACYRRIMRTRQALPSLQDGSMELMTTGATDVLAFTRTGSGEDVLVVVAFGSDETAVRLPAPRHGGTWQRMVGTHRDPRPSASTGRGVVLRPYEAVVFAARDG